MEPVTWIIESDHIGGKGIGWVRAKSMLLMAILCVGGPAAVFGQGPTIYGQVILEDGTPVSEFIRVEMVCNGRVIRQVSTREQGVFTFELEGPAEPMDATVMTPGRSGFGIGTNDGLRVPTLGHDPNDCEVHIAALPGFTSNYLRLGFRNLDQLDIGVIVLHRRTDVEGRSVSVKSLLAPEKARKAYQKAKKELAKKKIQYSKVIKELETAIQLYPEFSVAWNLLGESRLAVQDLDTAREAFQKAIAADSSYILPYAHLVRMELDQGRWKEADKLIELDPQSSQSHYFHAAANYCLGDFDLAATCLRVVEKNGDSENYPGTHLMLGRILAQEGKVSAAAEQLRRFLVLTPEREEDEIRENLKAQLAQWERQGLIEAASSP